MKKLFAILLALTLCVGALSMAAFAAGDYYCIAGTMNGWTSDSSDRLTDNGDGTYSITFANMAAGEYKFKFTKNGSWDGCYGGIFLASGQEADLQTPGDDIVFTVAETADVVIVMNLNTMKFTVTIGGKVEDTTELPKIKVHISVPEGWGDVYAYVWEPAHLGGWPGTKVENGTIELPASFAGFIVNNNNGTQTIDIKDINLTSGEVWVTVGEAVEAGKMSYSLSYTNPDVTPEPEPEPEIPADIKIHVIVPDSWSEVYAYTYNPDQLGGWPGTKVENGVVEVPTEFEGFIVNNGGNGKQTGNILDIDLTKEEVWVVVGDDNSYALYYNEADVVIPEPTPTIKIYISAPESWAEVYAYTFNPFQCGNWPGVLVENGVIEIPASFEGFIVNNNAGAQTVDIKDIDLTKAEVWVTVGEAVEDGKLGYSLSYEAPQAPVEPVPTETTPATSQPAGSDTGNGPGTGDVIGIVVALMAVSGIALVAFKKKH